MHRAIIAAIALIPPAQTMAADTEPLNNSQLTADGLSLLPGTALSNVAGLVPNDVDFYQTPLAAGEVMIGMVTPLADLPSTFEKPDTIVGVFGESGGFTFDDDDDAGGEGYGSLFRFEAPATADYRVGVGGSYDFEFDGAASGGRHTETGDYVLTVGRVNRAVSGGGFADTEPANQTPAGSDQIPVSAGTARVGVMQLGESDVDYFRMDLKAGDVISAMVAPLGAPGVSFNTPDTLLGLFDSSGTNLVEINDDGGGYATIIVSTPGGIFVSPDLSSDYPYQDVEPWALGSALRASIPADGTYYLAVTGFGDVGFTGLHGEIGAYGLLVGVAVPEPASAMLPLVVVSCGLGRFGKRSRGVVSHLSRLSSSAQSR
jgi:hypothetical protein